MFPFNIIVTKNTTTKTVTVNNSLHELYLKVTKFKIRGTWFLMLDIVHVGWMALTWLLVEF